VLHRFYISETGVKFSHDTVVGMKIHTFRTTPPLAAIGLVALLAAACGGSSAPGEGPAEAQVIRIDGSSTVFPVTEAVAEEYQKANPGARVTVGESGTGGGFKKFCAGETDISDASRPIKPTEIEACAANGVDYIELPVAYDGLAVVVHPGNTWVDSMTVAELERLWEPDAQGKVTRWNQIRTGWPDEEIHLFGPGVASGTFDYFTEVIVGQEDASRGDYTSSEDDNVLVQGVAGDRYALGYFGYAYFEQNQDKLKLVAVDDQDETNGAGPIAPSPETVRNGTYHPLSRPIFIYPKLSALDRPEVLGLVEFYLAQGAALVREVGYVPLGDAEYEMVRARLAGRVTGTLYGEGTTGTLEERLRK